MESLLCVVNSGVHFYHGIVFRGTLCHVLSFLCVEQPVITRFSLSSSTLLLYTQPEKVSVLNTVVSFFLAQNLKVSATVASLILILSVSQP